VIELAAIEAARARIADVAVRTPLIKLEADQPPDTQLYLKLETLQPIGSFKIRGAANAVRCAPLAVRAKGLATASAGNMAQGVAYMGRELGLPARIVVPEHAPQAKLGAVKRLGGEVVRVSYEEWWQAIVDGRVPGSDGLFVHPVQDEHVMAGNGTIGLELLEQLPDLDAVVIPFGGGGLTVGIASALRALRPTTKVFTAEPATGAALTAALDAGEPTEVDYRPSFVDGSGSRRVLDGMWSLVSELVDGAFAVPIEEASAAVRLLAERVHVIAEGAGALALAAALAGRAGSGKIVCIVSGGNIDFSTLSEILAAPAGAASEGGAG
jgi:threonine dehydratase